MKKTPTVKRGSKPKASLRQKKLRKPNGKRPYFENGPEIYTGLAIPIYGKYTRVAGVYRTGYRPPLEG